MPRLLSIDYGKKRCGIAVSDPLQIIANGLTTIDSPKLVDFLNEYLQKEQVSTIVVGLPKQMSGELSENMRRIEPFVNRIRKLYPHINIEYFDERFSSKLAFQTMIDGGVKKKGRQNKALIDEISATIILQGYMESKKIVNLQS